MQNALEGLYHRCPVREEIAGSLRSISKITAQTLYECHKRFYHPSNLILCVCGNITPAQVCAVADRMLPAAPAVPKTVRKGFREPAAARAQYVEARMPVAKPLFYLATKDVVLPADPLERLRRDVAMSLLSDVLFSRSSPFYSELFEEGLLTPSFSHGYSGTDRFAMHSICGESPDPQEVRRRVTLYLEKAQKEGLDPAGFERSRRCLIADEIRAYDSTEEIGYNLLSFALEKVDPFAYLPLLQSVTPEECRALIPQVFVPARTCLSVVLPSNAQNNQGGTVL